MTPLKGKEKLHVLEVPIEASDIFISSSVKSIRGRIKIKEALCFTIPDNGDNVYNYNANKKYYLKGHGWQVVGTVTDTEVSFDCEPYVEKHEMEGGNLYYNYNGSDFLTNKDKSFRSLIEKETGKSFVNTYPHPADSPPKDLKGYREMKVKWREAENNRLKKCIILKEL